MKKLISLALILLLTLSLAACGESQPSETISTDTPPTETTDSAVFTDSQPASVTTEEEPEEPPVEYETLTIQIHECMIPGFASSHIRTKTLSDEWTEGLIEKLLQAPETGTIVEKLSDQEISPVYFEGFAERLNIKRGMLWFLARDSMFRFTGETLCRVEKHLGEGKEIELSEELKEMLTDAYLYAPTNRYIAQWENGTLQWEHAFEGKHEIEISIEEITEIPATDSKSAPKYGIKLSLLSKKDNTVNVYLGPLTEDSDGIIFVEEKNIELNLKANQKQIRELVVEGFPTGLKTIPAVMYITLNNKTDSLVSIAFLHS